MAVLDFTPLKELFGERQDLIDGALRQYRQALYEDTSALTSAVRGKDLKEVEAVAHKAKGAAFVVGADIIGDICAGIEAAARVATGIPSPQKLPY